MSCYFSDAHSDAFHVKIFTVPKCIHFKPLLCKINKTEMILVKKIKKNKNKNKCTSNYYVIIKNIKN